jgi:2-dehydro-3-deoxyphosphogluconate aldolase/(4S)-4-hydroxy-2-oxoglutarate aldolase
MTKSTAGTQGHALDVRAVLDVAPVVPVVVLHDAEHAVPLAEALLRGGIGIIEITLRTPAGLAAIERVAAEVPETAVGAGTVTTPEEVAAARRAGARAPVVASAAVHTTSEVEVP